MQRIWGNAVYSTNLVVDNAGFFTHPEETLDLHYERRPDDPRVQQSRPSPRRWTISAT